MIPHSFRLMFYVIDVSEEEQIDKEKYGGIEVKAQGKKLEA